MINVGEVLLNLWESSGFSYIFANMAGGGWQNLLFSGFLSGGSSGTWFTEGEGLGGGLSSTHPPHLRIPNKTCFWCLPLLYLK